MAARGDRGGGGKDRLDKAQRDVLGDENSSIGVVVTQLCTFVKTC